MSNLESIYNSSAFDGTVKSDFMELGIVPETLKAEFVDYSVNDFSDLKTAMLNYIKAVYPADYNNFAESDLGIMLVELFAYMSSVMSFKADMIANEMFLPTVSTTTNLRKLLQLIGVSLKGPISSKATAVMTLPDGSDVSGSTTLTIPFANRTFSVASTKDGSPLFFTLYPVNLTTGNVNLNVTDILQTSGLSLTGSGKTFNNLILLEGELRTKTDEFSQTDTIHTIELEDSSIVEGSIVVSSLRDGIYSEVQNLFLADDGDEKSFEKVYKGDYAATLVFGDNARGKSPTPGDSYKVFYRVGGGNRGNVPSRTLSVSIPATHSTTALGTVDALVENTTHSTGGASSETVEHAKRWSPYFFKTQYRAVTGEDYTAFANQFLSTAGLSGKCQSALRRSGAGANMIDIYVVSKASDLQLERASIIYKKELLSYLNNYKMLTDELTIVDGLVRTIDLVTTIFLDREFEIFEEEIKRKASDKITSFFNVDNRDFGERFKISELTRDLFSIPEVRFANIDNLTEDIKLNFNEILQLNNSEINVEYV
tara:strand:+ start:2058 stop:3677 length:1620 start_codon:yes stop_codon:yes gene_type:complete